MQKKKLLLINKSFCVGGIQTSMINMANALKDRYDITVFVYYDGGSLRNRLSGDIPVLQAGPLLRSLGMQAEDFKGKKCGFLRLYRVFASVWTKLFDNSFPIRLALLFEKKHTGYDAAIAFHHEVSKKILPSGFGRFALKKTDAPLKLSWIHFDARKINMDYAFNRWIYAAMDKILCVSGGTRESFLFRYPEFAQKCGICYNFHDFEGISEKSTAPVAVPYPDGAFRCFSACRLTGEKDIPRAVNAFAPLFSEYPELFWYIAGDGPDRKAVESAVREQGLEDRIRLLNRLENPYPYMKQADLFILPSVHEAAPMVYGEAAFLELPVLTTDVSSAREMVLEGKEGFICENSARGLYHGLRGILEHRERLEIARKYLRENKRSNQSSEEAIEGTWEK